MENPEQPEGKMEVAEVLPKLEEILGLIQAKMVEADELIRRSKLETTVDEFNSLSMNFGDNRFIRQLKVLIERYKGETNS